VSEIKRFPFTAILGWSTTRYAVFSICRRRYYYQYYAKYDQEFPIRRIQQLRDLVSIPLEVGSMVHEVIEALLNRLKLTTEQVDQGKFFDFARRHTEHHLRTQSFEEVLYGEKASISVDDILPKVSGCLENLLASPRLTWLQERPTDTRSRWIVDPPGYGETRLGDLKLYCKVDFLCPVEDGYQIIDWKTGKEDQEKHRKQLIAYSAWAAYQFDAAPEKVTPTLAYLQPDYHEHEEAFSQFDLDNFAVQVQAETDEMYEYCRDVPLNIPVGKNQFPLIDDDRICPQCNFRNLCYPDRHPVRDN
jgi:hypothetical protein